MAITFDPLHPVFAAECVGVDIGSPLDAATVEAIHEGMGRYAVLVFRREVPLTTQQQLAVTAVTSQASASRTINLFASGNWS